MRNTAKILVLIGVLLVAGGLIPTAQAQVEERILSFHSDIQVMEDSSMTVTETIRVTATGDQIRRGIYRDFPIAYEDRLGRQYVVGFEVLGVMRDGQPEPYHTERAGNGVRVYMGQEGVFLEPGQYEYALTYRTDRQLGFYDLHDELYWNVTGTAWDFPIDSATATVHLPGEIMPDQIRTTLYTGPQGSTEQRGTATVTGSGEARFATTRGLGEREGLTIVVGWPKGFVTPPSATENFWAAVKTNLDFIVGLGGLVIVLAYYLYTWHKRGRDPRKSTVIAQYESPSQLSPAMTRHIQRMGGDARSLASSIISLGVKGALSVKEEKEGFFKKTVYTLTRKADDGQAGPALAEEETILLNELFSKGESVKLSNKNHRHLSKVQKKFFKSLKQQAGKRYFARNTGLVVLGVALSAAALIGAFACAILFRYTSSFEYSLFWIGLVLVMTAVNIVFGRLLRAYTTAGRQLADEIEGFKLFLNVTEKDRLAFHNPPERTPELFERMLPYALALGVEHEWAEQFAAVFARQEAEGVHYAPVWYYGSFTNFSAGEFADNMGSSFTGAVAAASSPPGSGSGASGGSSGGGGGGGGGGGW